MFSEDSNTLDNYLIMTKKQKVKQKAQRKQEQLKSKRKDSTQLSIFSWLIKDRPKQNEKCLIIKLDKSLIMQIFKFLRLSQIMITSRVCQYFHHCSQSVWINPQFFGQFQTEKFTLKQLSKVMEKSSRLSHIKQLKQIYLGKNIGTCRQKIKLKVTTGISVPGILLELFQVSPKNNRNCAFLSDNNLQQIVNSSYRSLRVVNLHYCIYLKNLEILSRCFQLTKLSITANQYLNCENVKRICKRCQLLEQVAFVNCRNLQDEIFVYISKLENLQKFTLRGYKQTFQKGQKLSENQNLKHLDFQNSYIMDSELISIIKQCKKLQFLNIKGCQLLTDDFIKQLIFDEKEGLQILIYKTNFSCEIIDKIKQKFHSLKLNQNSQHVVY